MSACNPIDAHALAEALRVALSRFIRGVKTGAQTPTTSQSETLSLLDREGPLSVAQLADRRNVRHQSMRLVVGQLETEKLIGKTPNPADRRSELLFLTEEGHASLSRARQARTAQIAERIEERLSEEDRQTLDAAIRIIERLC
ncbi:MarR family transcriptional regulator [Agrobacterium sp. MS2]|uniref:MarR family winged helix-turn-helix transcriptional regulator n=1 Tax=Agrobacterium sp. MS2 TaxID=1345498 RepID=UPI000DB77FB4|nr:MarR family transcriptional regulator [Agrobacterium sp. MS2]PZP56849.1 MAG: MarR family transcriptional regulator [Delftia acidovorans]RAL96921.1 MarR family transcriptional regulator [Agrobacterium sp. MS2]